MRIVYFGSSSFSLPPLKSIASSVISVATRKAKAKGRGYLFEDNEVKQTAISLGLPVVEIDSFKDPAAQSLADLKADLFVVASFGLIIPKWFLDSAIIGPVNIHPSLLPKYRGPSPLQWTILNQDAETGITFIKMNEKMDAGDILYQKKTAVLPDENAATLSAKLSILASELLPTVIDGIGVNGIDHGVPQTEEEATFTVMVRKEMGRIDWNRPSNHISAQIRAFVTWPSAFTFLDGKMLKVFDAQKSNTHPLVGSKPGTILAVNNAGIEVATMEDSIVLSEVQLENKKRMSASEFSHGYKDLLGKQFQ
jgi:methionyl-tRNA formyltransferase